MDLSPKQIVHKLDKYIIGQDEAKRRWQSRLETVIVVRNSLRKSARKLRLKIS